MVWVLHEDGAFIGGGCCLSAESLSVDQASELLVVDGSGAVSVGLVDEVVNLLRGEVIAGKGVQEPPEVSHVDDAPVALVEDPEGVLELLLLVVHGQFALVHLLELVQGHEAGSFLIVLIRPVLERIPFKFAAQGLEGHAQILGGDGLITALVEQVEALCGVSDVLLGEDEVSHGYS